MDKNKKPKRFLGRVAEGSCILVGVLLLLGCSKLPGMSSANDGGSGGISSIQTTLSSLETDLEATGAPSLSPEQTASVNALTDDLNASMANRSQATDVAQQLIQLDPTHPVANLYLVDNDLYVMSQDSELKAAYGDLLSELTGKTVSGTGVFALGGAKMAASDPVLTYGIINAALVVGPSGVVIQQKTRTVLEKSLPALDAVIAHLHQILLHGKDNFSFSVEAAPGHPTTVYRNDILALYSALSAFRGVISTVVAYDMVLPEGSYVSGAEAFSKNSSFGTLRPDGLKSMQEARISFGNALFAYLGLLKNAMPNPDLQARYGFAGDLTVTRLNIENVYRSIKGETTDLVYKVKLGEGDNEFRSVNLPINLKAFFDNPIRDFRSLLGINLEGELDAADFPAGFDFTIHGLFPTLKSFEDWRENAFLGLRFYKSEGESLGLRENIYELWPNIVQTDRYIVMSNSNWSRGLIQVYDASTHQFVTNYTQQSGYFGSSRPQFSAYKNIIFLLNESYGKPEILKISNGTIQKIGEFGVSGASRCSLSGTTLSVYGSGTLYRYDVSDPEAPVLLSQRALSSYYISDFSDDRVMGYQPAWSGESRLFLDVSGAISSYTTQLWYVRGMKMSSKLAVVCGSAGYYGTQYIEFYAISPQGTMSLARRISPPAGISSLDVQGDKALIQFRSGLIVIYTLSGSSITEKQYMDFTPSTVDELRTAIFGNDGKTIWINASGGLRVVKL
ncbi:MAG: hypothetical protein AB7F28_03220 [Candidatus Margulisiibacteriota bacterium]